MNLQFNKQSGLLNPEGSNLLTEINFERIDQKVEKVDYNFYEKDDGARDDPSQNKYMCANTFQNLQIPEDRAFALYDKIFKNEPNDIELFRPDSLMN